MNRRIAANVAWRKSSYCDHGGCIEVARSSLNFISIRDSTDANGPRLSFNHAQWKEFIRQPKQIAGKPSAAAR
jgi:hypothetical protein